MNNGEQIDYLVQSIENLIDAKFLLENGGNYKRLSQARLDVRVAIAILFNIDLK